MKILAIILIMVGVGGILGKEFLVGVLFLIAGLLMLKKLKPKKTNTSKSKYPPSPGLENPEKPSKENHFFFNVAGISKTNDRGEDIQSLIKRYVAEQLEYGGEEKYEGMTNKEILEYGDDVYEVDLDGGCEVTLELEPDNPYDPNAIKVIHDEIGHIGYVPTEHTARTKTALGNDCDIDWKLVGGKYKYVDDEEDKVKTKTLTYGMSIDIRY